MAQIGEVLITIRADCRAFERELKRAGLQIELYLGHPPWWRRLWLRYCLWRLARIALPDPISTP